MVDSFEITEEYKYGYIYILYSLFMLIPAISIQVRRLHDIGKSGFIFLAVLIITAGFKWIQYQYSEPNNSNNYIYNIIPVVGIIWLVYLYCKAGNPQQNKYDVLAQEAEKTQSNISTKE